MRLHGRTISAFYQGKATVSNGRHSVVDAPGLYLRVSGPKAGSWSFLATLATGERVEIAIGTFLGVRSTVRYSVAEARAEADRFRVMIKDRKDPRIARAAAKSAPTFKEMLDSYLATQDWKGDKQKIQWRQQLRDYCGALMPIPVNRITTERLVEMITPIWDRTLGNEQRRRIESVMKHARAKLGDNYAWGDNPASLERFRVHLPPPTLKGEGESYTALPYELAPTFFADLSLRVADKHLPATALALVMFSGGRAGEVVRAEWTEFNLDKALWTVPSARMKGTLKGSREHLVPLPRQVVEMLRELKRRTGNSRFLFPQEKAAKKGVDAPMGNTLMNELIERIAKQGIEMGDKGIATPHGMRSTFSDWANDETDFDAKAIDQCLAHKVTDKTEGAYRRRTAVNKRRVIMQAYADYLGSACDVQLREAA